LARCSSQQPRAIWLLSFVRRDRWG
jgi:hypothetical protein